MFGPTLLQKGRRYAYHVITAGNHFMATVTGNKNGNGSLFYSTDGAWFMGDLDRDIPTVLYFAQFASPRAEVQMEPLQLENGIKDIDLTYDSFNPSQTSITWEIQVNGAWKALSESGSPATNGLPPLLPLRAVLVGTTDLMPGFGVGNRSRAITFRPRSDFRHISTPRTLPVPCTSVEVTLLLEYFDVGRHTNKCQLMVGPGLGTPTDPTSVIDSPILAGPNAISRRYIFELAAPISEFAIRTEGTTDNVLVTYHVAERFDLSFT
jgi:hypothetical protein